jgi:hypothetical protein
MPLYKHTMSSLINSVLELLSPGITCGACPVVIISEQTRLLLQAVQEQMGALPYLPGHDEPLHVLM